MNGKKERVIILNHVHILESYSDDGGWKIINTIAQAPRSLKSGVYLLSSARMANRQDEIVGQIIHIDKNFIYQLNGKKIIKYNFADLSKPPKLGENVLIKNFSCQIVDNIHKKTKN